MSLSSRDCRRLRAQRDAALGTLAAAVVIWFVIGAFALVLVLFG